MSSVWSAAYTTKFGSLYFLLQSAVTQTNQKQLKKELIEPQKLFIV